MKKAIAIIFILLVSIISQSIAMNQQNTNEMMEETTIEIFLISPLGKKNFEKTIPLELADTIYNHLIDESLNHVTKHDLIDILTEKVFSEKDISKKELIDQLTPPTFYKTIGNNNPAPSSVGSEFFCSIISGGSGKLSPIISLPRPRLFLSWEGYGDNEIAITTVGGINSEKGFIVYGEQNGLALGFAGIGITYGTPIGRVYGLTGYSLYTRVSGDNIDFYPPNSKPVISDPTPSNNEGNIPLSLSELSFQIHDDDNQFMNYTVTTNPDIGSGNGQNKRNGYYSFPISGLEGSTTYIWDISVSDGKDTTYKSYTFTTVYEAPLVTQISPGHAEFVTTDLSELSFSISDPQGDLMDYSVETSPDIGSKLESGVSDGSFSVPINGLVKDIPYKWYINVTDGAHMKSNVYMFSTSEYHMVAYWDFNQGSGNNVIDDSGFDNDGVIHGAQWVTGVKGSGLLFDGVNDYIRVSDSDSISIGNQDLTLSAWIKPFSLEYDATILSKTHDGGNKEFLLSHRDDSEPNRFIDYKIENNRDDNDFVSTNNPTLDLNEWNHIAVTFNAGDFSTKIYHNGVQQTTIGSIDELPQMLDDDLTIGIYDDGNFLGDPFYGIMDEISIYNRELTANEILDIYENIV